MMTDSSLSLPGKGQGEGASRCPSGLSGAGPIHTIGHSTRPIEVFVTLLQDHAVTCVVDVRRWPGSRRSPQFAKDALAASLAAAGVEYAWRQDLGGYRAPSAASPNTGWRHPAFRAYADYMLTPEFEAAMDALARLAADRRIAVMCAEADPRRCHRQLVADACLVRGWTVRHILDGGCQPHQLTPFAHPTGSRILYGAEGELFA